VSFVTTAVTVGPLPHSPEAKAPAFKDSRAILESYPKIEE